MNTNKKIILASAITLATLNANALPFAPADARSMGMGGTGVSSSEVASTVQFNPALLANTRSDDHFGLKLPQFSVSASDEDDFIDEVDDFDTESPLAIGSGKTNVDLLSDTLDIASDEVTGLPGLADAVDNFGTTLAGQGTTHNAAELSAASSKIDSKVSGLRGTVISTDDDINTAPDSDLVKYSAAVADDLDDLNSKAIRVNTGVNVAVAVPSKKFSMALSASGQGVFSGKINVPQTDSDQLRNYSAAMDQYLTTTTTLTTATTDLAAKQAVLEADPSNTAKQDAVAAAITVFDTANTNFENFNYGGSSTEADDGETIIFKDGELVADDTQLNSTVHMIGAAIGDFGLSVSRSFNIKGHDIAFGITPKMQMVTIFEYIFELDGKDSNGNEVEFDEDSVTDNTEDYSTFNMDIGSAYQFGETDQWQAGLVIKNIMSKDFETSNGGTISISPAVRAGISHKTSWSKVAFDLDLTKNDPVAFEDSTQYAAIGAELDLFRFAQLRAGYRANLAASDQDIMTFGIGLSPFAVHLDIGLMANPSDIEKEAGVAVEFGVEF